MTAVRRRALFAGGLLALLSTFILFRLEIVLDISHFMLGDPNQPLVRLSKQLAQSPGSRTLVVLLEASEPRSALQLGRDFEAQLRANPEVMAGLESLRGGPEAGVDEAMWRLYEGRQLAFVATTSVAAKTAVGQEGLRSALTELLARLRSPASTLYARVAPSDPLLVLPQLFERMARLGAGGVVVRDGRFLTNDERGAVLFLRTRASAFNGSAHAPLLDAIRSAYAGLSPSKGLKLSGVHRFSVEIERSIKADIQRVSILSILALVVLIAVLFRSLRLVGAGLLIVSSGFCVGLAVILALFGRVHGLTLAFGASLIGVAIDYAIHFFVHYSAIDADERPEVLLGRLGPGITLGAATTVAGFIALASSGLPGLFEVSIFAATGIAGAWAATFVFIPLLAPARPRAVVVRKIARGMDSAFRRSASTSRALPGLFLISSVVLSGWLLSKVRWDDDVARLTRLDPELVDEEEAVRARINPFEEGRLVVATGTTVSAALGANDRVSEALAQAKAAGEVDRYRTLATFLPSPRTQAEVAQAVQSEKGLRDRFLKIAFEMGFSEASFRPFLRELEAEPMAPLDYETFSRSVAGRWAESFRVDLGNEGQVGFISFLGGVRKPEAIQARAESLEDVIWFDRARIYLEANRSYRERTVWGLVVGFAVVLTLVGLRYRELSSTALSLVPASMAVLFTAGVLGLLGFALNVVALTALLMVFSMGVDYGVFLSERSVDRSATLLSVGVAWASTLAGFGLLALSEHPAMQTIGMAASIGVSATLVFAVAVLVLVDAGPPSTSEKPSYG